MNEQWRPVKGYEELYLVSSRGRIKRIDAAGGRTWVGRVLRQATMTAGYLTVSLSQNGRPTTRCVHRLVAEAFLGPVPEGKQVNHKDGDKENNTTGNLEYVTPRENQLHASRVLGRGRGSSHWKTKLTEDDVKRIHELSKEGETQYAIGARFGIAQTTVSGIVRGVNWSHVKPS